MTKINPSKYEEEFLNWLNNNYQGSNKRRFRYYTEEIFRQGREGEFLIDTDNSERTIADLKHLIRYDLDYSLWPPVSYAHQKLLDYLIERVPNEEKPLNRIRDGISPSEFEEMAEQNYFSKSIEEKAKRRKKQLIDGKVLQNVFEDVPEEKETILRTLYDTACRRGEFVAIKVKDLNFDTKFAPVIIELRRQATQNDEGKFVVENTLKIRENREVMAGKRSKKLLKKHIEENNLESDDFVFFPDVKRSTAYGKLKDAIVEAFEGYPKPEKLTPHNFRHTRATEIVRDLTLNDAKEYLGHEHIQNTEVYSHIDIKADVLKKISDSSIADEEGTSREESTEDSSAVELLKKKYVEDEISKEEFEEKIEVLTKFS